jgi:hypothetical protein
VVYPRTRTGVLDTPHERRVTFASPRPPDRHHPLRLAAQAVRSTKSCAGTCRRSCARRGQPSPTSASPISRCRSSTRISRPSTRRKAPSGWPTLFRSHDIVFLATPEYNGGVRRSSSTPSPGSAGRSRARSGTRFRHRRASASGKYGTIWSLSHLRDTLSKIGALVVPTLLGVGPYPATSSMPTGAGRKRHPVQGRPDGARTDAFFARRNLAAAANLPGGPAPSG